MPVQTFVMGTSKGPEETFEELDKRVNDAERVANWEIISIQDLKLQYPSNPRIIRRVLYKDKP